MMEVFIFLFVCFIGAITIIVEQIQKARGKTTLNSYTNTKIDWLNADRLTSETLPNGYTRQDYHDYGISDEDIEFWGLDQPGAPNPMASGFVIDEMFNDDDFSL